MSVTTFYMIIIGVTLFCYGLTCWALVDGVYRKFGSVRQKAIWLAVAFIPFAGWLIYFLFGTRRGVRSKEPPDLSRLFSGIQNHDV